MPSPPRLGTVTNDDPKDPIYRLTAKQLKVVNYLKTLPVDELEKLNGTTWKTWKERFAKAFPNYHAKTLDVVHKLWDTRFRLAYFRKIDAGLDVVRKWKPHEKAAYVDVVDIYETHDRLRSECVRKPQGVNDTNHKQYIIESSYALLNCLFNGALKEQPIAELPSIASVTRELKSRAPPSATQHDAYTCHRCSNKYDERKHRPLILSECEHVYCEPCLIAIRAHHPRTQHHTYVCPECKRITTCDSGAQLDYVPQRIAFTKRQKTSKHDDDDDTQHFTGNCDACKINGFTSKANFGCATCKQNHCTSCWNVIHAHPSRMRHFKQLVCDFSSAFCSEHPSMIADMVCVKPGCAHYRKLVCELCKGGSMHDDHKNMHFASIDAVVQSDRSKMDTVISSSVSCVENTRQALQTFTSSFPKHLQYLEEKTKRAHADIDAWAKSHTAALTASCKTLTSDAETQIPTTQQTVTKYVNCVAESLLIYDHDKHEALELMKRNDPYEIIERAPRLRRSLERSPVLSMSTSSLQGHTHTLLTTPCIGHAWHIPNFSASVHKTSCFPKYVAMENAEFSLNFSPRTSRSSRSVARISAPNASFYTGGRAMTFTCILRVVNHDDYQLSISKVIEAAFHANTLSVEWKDIIVLDSILRTSNGFLLDDTLTIEFAVFSLKFWNV